MPEYSDGRISYAAGPGGLDGPGAETDATQGQGQGLSPDIQKLAQQLLKWSQSPNIAADIDPNKLMRLGLECCYGYEIDRRSRKEWEDRSEAFMDMALQRVKPKNWPWPQGSNVMWPLLSQAVNEFASAIYPVIMDGDRVVKGKILGSDKGVPDEAKMQEMLAAAQQMAAMQQAGPGVGAMQPAGPEMMPGGAAGGSGEPPEQPKIPYMPGKEPGAKRRRADHVSEHMSWQLLSQQKEWQTDSDRLFRALPILGCGARKSWFDPVWGRNCSMYVSMMDLVVNYYAKSLETAPRLTEVSELYPYEIVDNIRSGIFIKFEHGTAVATDENIDEAQAWSGDRYAPHVFLEQHCFWDLDDDGYMEPYTVTIHKQSQKVVRVTARYDADGIRLTEDRTQIAKIEPLHYYTLFQFMPNPESAIYGHGFGHILGPINESINSAINQMFDAGTLQNVQGGFVGSGLSMHAGALRFKMGEFRPVQSTGPALRDNFFIPDFKGPSQVMFAMFGLLVEAGRELAGIKAVTTGQTPPASTDPQTMMAMLEQGMRVFKDVHKRVLRGLNEEYAKLFALNRKYMPKQGFKYQRADEEFQVSAEDYATTSGVETVGDPNMVTDMQKLARAQLIAPFKDDQRCDGKAIIRRIFEAGNVEDIDELVLEQQAPNPFAMLELQLKQAEIAGAVVQQQKDHAQSILYLMQARKAAAEADVVGLEAQIDAQLDREWQAIEHTNNQLQALELVVKAEKVEVDRVKANKPATKKAS